MYPVVYHYLHPAVFVFFLGGLLLSSFFWNAKTVPKYKSVSHVTHTLYNLHFPWARASSGSRFPTFFFFFLYGLWDIIEFGVWELYSCLYASFPLFSVYFPFWNPSLFLLYLLFVNYDMGEL